MKDLQMVQYLEQSMVQLMELRKALMKAMRLV